MQYVRVSEEERPGGPVTLDDARRKMGLAETMIADRTFAVSPYGFSLSFDVVEGPAHVLELCLLAPEQSGSPHVKVYGTKNRPRVIE
jgi:hypothetical protein